MPTGRHVDNLYYLRVDPWALRFASGYTEVLQGGTISMPTGRHVDNDFIPGLKTKSDF